MNKGAIATFKCISTVKWRNHGHNSVSNIMKEIVLYVDDRPPVMLTGDYLGSSAHNSENEHLDYHDNEAINKFAEECDKDCHPNQPPTGSIRRLKMYRSKSGKIIVYDECFSWDNRHFNFGASRGKSSLEIYEDLSEFLHKFVKEDGTYGYLTHGLMSNIANSDPEAKRLWIQKID